MRATTKDIILFGLMLATALVMLLTSYNWEIKRQAQMKCCCCECKHPNGETR